MSDINVVGIGANVMDTLITLPHYPAEDTKLRAEGITMAGGGPCATGLVAASKLGVSSGYIGVLSDDNGGRFLLDDLKKYNVNTDCVTVEAGHRSFTSVIWLSLQSSSRTCVFDRGDLPKLVLNENSLNAIKNAQVLMVDGNELDAACMGAEYAQKHNTKVLYDCGGLYNGVERLLALTDIMIPSEEFAKKHTGADNVNDAARILMDKYSPEAVIITCGKEGGLYYNGTDMHTYPAFKVNAVDTNGSGDVFHGAFAAAVVKGLSYEDACIYASAVSAIKCMGIGARKSVPDHETTLKFLKENGYEL